jgi:hypothetical protein
MLVVEVPGSIDDVFSCCLLGLQRHMFEGSKNQIDLWKELKDFATNKENEVSKKMGICLDGGFVADQFEEEVKDMFDEKMEHHEKNAMNPEL